ncbi:hypothetical protein [Flavobacterium sp. GT3R68]|uniref:hypothetical protein n=1 Tax=Flavobacterium sp. GT3R68 TaxID=2594437 RepID=UPI000F899345|nr:hypothetical protein [Flavobacterium sp. GT3R68]RTY94941.1 hypothetical protein EKL32_08450 [Flavobacterium sp. GSN2]TRW91745.1 hypothetical protein FNW07_07625 [Flavobacterium sp. GT3R68]
MKLSASIVAFFMGYLLYAQEIQYFNTEENSIAGYPDAASDTLYKRSRLNKRPKFMVNITSGPSIRMGETPKGLTSEQSNYIKDLKSGFSYDISTYYLKDEQSGFGLKYNVYKSSGSLSNQDLTAPNGETGNGTASDDITITFIGASGILYGKGFFALDNVSFEIALGYIGYVDKAVILDNYTIKGGNLGISTSVGYHFGITENIAIGPSVSFTGGVLNQVKVEGDNYSATMKFDEDEKESLYRFDFSLSARFKF